MSKAKEEYEELFTGYVMMSPTMDVYRVRTVCTKYIKELEEQNKEMMDLLIQFKNWLKNEKRGTYDVDNLIEKIKGKSIEEVLEDE